MNRNLGKAAVWSAIIGLVAGVVLLWALLARSCGGSTTAGQRADSVLASDTAYARDTLRQDSALAALDAVFDSAVTAHRTDSVRQARTTDSLEAVARGLARQAAAIDAGLGNLAGGAASDSVAGLIASRDLWRRSSLHYSTMVVPALRRQVELEAGARLDAIARLTAKADTLRHQRDYARRRANELTREFKDYRDASREGLDLGFIRLPEWADDVVLVAGTAALTCAVTC